MEREEGKDEEMMKVTEIDCEEGMKKSGNRGKENRYRKKGERILRQKKEKEKKYDNKRRYRKRKKEKKGNKERQTEK